jgi:IPT/TIG domain
MLALPTATLLAQNSPTIATVDPASGKVGDSVTVTGEKLGKASVVAVFLSDDKSDYKAVVVEQSEEKIVIKIPQVKHGSYNLSFQQGTAIYIQPVRFTVED